MKCGKFGYQVTRQRGSHLRLSTAVGGVHHLTVPDHDPLRLGIPPHAPRLVRGNFPVAFTSLQGRLSRWIHRAPGLTNLK